MIFRFCLYGLLKNQRYFAPFWVLAFLDKGLSFATIGSLIGVREISVTLLEVPTGAIADTLGRRWAMICSHLAYVAAFFTFAFADNLAALFAGMFAFAVGEAFRTGTHKAIIFTWLKSQGRESEKTEIYGRTRSWSQIGSALSTVIAASLVFALQDYTAIFWLSAIPASLNVVNFLGYPKELDGASRESARLGSVFATIWQATLSCFRSKQLSRPIAESMGFEGVYTASKDYLQPIIQQMVLAMPILAAWDATRRTSMLVAIIYTSLYVLSSVASRRAGRIAERLGGNVAAARTLWRWFGIAYFVLLVGTLAGWHIMAVSSFVLLAVLQNIWRPILVSRVADHADEAALATVLSVESQAKSLGAAIAAPIIGLAVDLASPHYQFVPIAGLGILVAVMMGRR
ncbi:MAG: MFS transporter [Planctomycetales bacterium]|nr:MFS transporter [Planctomycetales bacterium]